MNELIIELTEISPREFFGLQNANIDLLKKYFPKLKIVARGSKIKAYGDEEILEEFDSRLTMLLEHFAKYNKLDENVIELVLQSKSSADYETPVSRLCFNLFSAHTMYQYCTTANRCFIIGTTFALQH